MGRILLYCATVFLSAFLLFQVQPVIGRYILPWFGSTPGVWTTCMLFFQVLLLGGYTYAHFVVSRLTPKRQAIAHAVLLGLALIALPITPSEDLMPRGDEAPVGAILWVLALSVGLPYLVLSSTGPLLQGWFSRLHPGRSPYRLYALSNVGSLLALISYPLWVEPHQALADQTLHWSLGFGAFALLGAACAWTLHRGRVAPAPVRHAPTSEAMPLEALRDPESAAVAAGGKPGLSISLLWFALSATGSAFLLATTNQMCLDVAVVPFLWVAPLAIYLLTFILTFDHERWYVRPLFLALLPLVIWNAYSVLAAGVNASIGEQMIGYGQALFVVCMCCHGELSRGKPAPRYLTYFFLIVSLGGAAGGLLVALAAPMTFDDFYEYPLLLAVASAVVLLGVFYNVPREAAAPQAPWRRIVWYVALAGSLAVAFAVAMHMLDPQMWVDEADRPSEDGILLGWFGSFRPWLIAPAVALPLLVEIRRWLSRTSFVAWWGRPGLNAGVAAGIFASIGLIGMVAGTGWTLRKPAKRRVMHARNFYGTLAIKEYSAGKRWHDWTLRHGRIMHGFQYKRRPTWPTSYYGPRSGVGRAIRHHPERWSEGRPFRIGVVGLGTGTLAAYANARIDPDAHMNSQYAQERRRVPGDVVRYYEINPLVVDWSFGAGKDAMFTYMGDAAKRGADVAVYLGDARLVMQRQLKEGSPEKFDVLAIDAFSSDAIPIHLLTKESFRVYLDHLAEGGALAIHVTNRFIKLVPVVRALAEDAGMPVVHIDNYSDDDKGVDSSDWLIVTKNEAMLKPLRRMEVPLPAAGPLWTDDFSSVWELVKYGEIDMSWEAVPSMMGLPEEALKFLGFATREELKEKAEENDGGD